MTSPADLDRLHPRDRAYVEALEDAALRETIVSTIARYQRESRLAAGDRIPSLPLYRLEDGSRVDLPALHQERPLVLVFGSFT